MPMAIARTKSPLFQAKGVGAFCTHALAFNTSGHYLALELSRLVIAARPNYNHAMQSTIASRVAVYFAVIQCFFALGWTVYVLFLPELLARAGVDKSWKPWVLALDQLIFAGADLAMGLAVDRARAGLRRIGPMLLGVTAVSSLAMLLMPTASGFGGGVFLALTMIWVATSAALRAPPFALLGSYAAKAEQPRQAALQLLGLALAAALAPYLGLTLKGIDPALPFALASAAILVSSGGLVWAERQLTRLAPSERGMGIPLPFTAPAALLMMAALLLAALGFQLHVAINAVAQIKRVVDAGALSTMLPMLLPVFWVGFTFGLLPTSALSKRFGDARSAALGCLIGALSLVASSYATSIPMLATAHALAGVGWALTMANGIGLAAASGRAGAEGRYTSLFFCVLALGTLGRIAVSLSGVPQTLPDVVRWLPVIAWTGAALLLLQVARRRLS